jgi:hypothetical protein
MHQSASGWLPARPFYPRTSLRCRRCKHSGLPSENTLHPCSLFGDRGYAPPIDALLKPSTYSPTPQYVPPATALWVADDRQSSPEGAPETADRHTDYILPGHPDPAPTCPADGRRDASQCPLRPQRLLSPSPRWTSSNCFLGHRLLPIRPSDHPLKGRSRHKFHLPGTPIRPANGPRDGRPMRSPQSLSSATRR